MFEEANIVSVKALAEELSSECGIESEDLKNQLYLLC